MPRPRSTRPTDAELEILHALWDLGPATVREVHERLARHRTTGYTTVLKLMQIMTDKGLLEREGEQRANAHVYRPAVARESTQRQLLRDLLDRAFGGSARALILQALSAKKSTPQELAEIRKMIEHLERGKP